jgi:hypothetical protein
LAGGETFFTAFSAAAFLSSGAFLAGADVFAGAAFFAEATGFAAGFFATGAGFEGLTAGFALPFTGAGFEVVFFAAMAQRWECGW